MGFRIRTNTESLTAQRQLSGNYTELNTSMEKLSSGMRINKSADDAAGLAVSESLRAKVRGLGQARRNANDGVSMVQVAEGSLNEISNIMIRMRELTVQSGSDTIGERERSFLQKEFGQLSSEIDRISSVTEFNGLALLGPSESGTGPTIQIGYNGGEADRLTLELGDMPDGINVASLGLADARIDGGDRGLIIENLAKLDESLQKVAGARASLGATQSRLGSSINNLSISVENMSAANSRIRDVDFAEETAKMTQNRILTQAGTSVLVQANQKPEMALALLR